MPDVGGGYTFTAQVFDTFTRLVTESRHDFVAFCSPELIARRNGGPVEYCPISAPGFLGKAYAALKCYSPTLGYFAPRSRFERLALGRHIDMAWFVGGGAQDIVDIPYIATVWDIQHRTHPWFPETSHRGRWDYRELTQSRFLRRAAYVVTGTECGRDQLGWYYQIPKNRIRILPHPTPALTTIDRAASELRAGVSSLLGEKYLLYPAQFWAHKNHVNLLYALKLLHEQHGLGIKLVLTGSDKGNLGHVRSITSQLGLIVHVSFLGFVSSEELSALYRNALALVYPSFSGPENLPPLEAFRVGCPVVISDYPGAREQVGEAAIYVDPHQPESIAAGIKQVITDPNLRDQLVEKGARQAASRTAERFVRGIFSILDEFETIRRCWN